MPHAAYVHVPFCRHRCGYCDFTLLAGRDDLTDDYLRALECELQLLERPREVRTLFIGGGTPTHFAPGELSRLLELVRRWFPLAADAEFSVEANPADLDEATVRVLADAGVNRISIGAQSFDANTLGVLERDHRPVDVARAVQRIRRRIENVSLDLIFGVPGQTCASWRTTLAEAIALEPSHVSTYGLTYEKGTSFWTRRRKGNLVPVPEDTERAQYAAAMDDLAAAGFEQYEISNFARPDRRCRHNETYWAGESYYGFGPGAARYVGGRRETNHRSVTTWLKRVLAGESAVGEWEELSDEERAREAAVLGLRLCAGIDRRAFRARTGFDLDELAGEALSRHRASGLLEEAAGRVRLTRAGRFLADTVIVDFL